MCDELACRISGCPERTGELAAKLRATIRESSRSSSTDQTWLQCRDHEDRGDVTVFHDPRLCGTGQIMWLMKRVLLPRDSAASNVKGWICGKKNIGPASEVAVSHHQRRYGIEIMIESSFGDGTCSWVMIVNGRNKYVTEIY